MTRPGRTPRIAILPAFGIAVLALLMGISAVQGATRTWRNFTGAPDNLWSTPANWLEGIAPASGDKTLDLIFSDAGSDPYFSSNDISNLLLNSLTLSGTEASLSGKSLEFQTDATITPTVQNGGGFFTINNDLIAADPITFLAVAATPGLVTLNGAISGGGGIRFDGGSWKLTNSSSSFGGGTLVRLGSMVELAPPAGDPLGIDLSSGNSIIGSGDVTLNSGGTLKLTTSGTSGITLSAGRRVIFNATGGTLDLRNSNSTDPTLQGGNIVAGDLAITLNNPSLAVIRFNGGQLGLSQNNAKDGNWNANGNTLRIGSIAGNGGNLQVELDNGAYYSATAIHPGLLTIRGTLGGDPTSGPTGSINTGIGTNFGRFGVNVTSLGFYAGLRFEDAVEVSIPGASRQITGNITVRGISAGHPGYVAFSGRATGTGNQLSSQLTSPGGGGPGQNVLHLGSTPVNSDTLAIEKGGTAVLDARLRIEQAVNHGVLLNSQTVIAAGAVLRFGQSMSNFNFDPTGLANAQTNANVGDILVRGRIVGQGTTADESLVDIQLPEPVPGGAPGVPETLTATPVANGVRPFGGLRFIDASQPDGLSGANQDFVVNGSGFGGLRVAATARPSSLFSGGVPDPVPNDVKLASVLTASRLARVSGTGGYLTPAPMAAVFTVPAGGMWIDPDIGLRATDHNAGGVDVSLSALSSWSRNLAVDAGATLDFGTANPFVLAGGTLHGSGTVTSTGVVQIAANASISPGLADVGTLNVQGNVDLIGRLLIDLTPATADALAVSGSISIGGRLRLSGNLGAGEVTIATYTGALTGTFSAITGLDPSFTIDYGTGANSAIKLVPSTQPMLVWSGAPGNSMWDTSTANWQGGAVFANRNRVIFDETNTGNRNIVIGGTGVSPSLITVSNTNPYTIESSTGASLGGTARLIKNGTGTLALKGPATYAGGTLVNGGEVRLESNDAIPDVGPVTIDLGSSLNMRGFDDTIEDLSVVNGAVLGANSTLTVASVTLGSNASVAPRLVLHGDVRKSGMIATNLADIDLGGGQRSFAIEEAANLAISGSVSNGSLVKAGSGTLTLSGTNSHSSTTITGGTLVAASAAALPVGSDVTIFPSATLTLGAAISSLGALESSGTVILGSSPLTVTSLAGSGAINLGTNQLTINQAIDTGYGGAMTGGGALVKSGAGILRLTAASTFTGGVTASGGILSLAAPAAAGTGMVIVNSGAVLDLSSPTSNPVRLNGGAIGSSTIGNFTGSVVVNLPSILRAADPKDPAVGSDLILAGGSLQGTGDLTIQGATGVSGADGAAGVRLRSTIASNYSGTITVLQNTKFELQTASATPFSPAGTGKIVLSAGTSPGDRLGTYSQLNLRNDRQNGDATLGNDVIVDGIGLANMNLVGTAAPGSITKMGNLRIGSAQILGINKDIANLIYGASFSSVTLTGDGATFAPTTVLMGYTGTADLILGPIGEIAIGSGIRMEGAGGLYLGGANSYTGPTTVSAGFMYLGAEGALPASTALTMAGGTVEFAYPGRTAFSQTVASLSGTFGLVTNSDFGNPVTFTVNQAADTNYEGSISGNLGLIKDGPGKLAVAGTNSYSEATLVNGGILEVNGVIDGSTLTVSAGAVLAGVGTISSPVLVQGTLAPGVNGPGTLTLTGDDLALGPNSQTLLEIADVNALIGFDRVLGIGTLTLDGTIRLSLLSGYTPGPGAIFNLFAASSYSSQSFNASTDLLLPVLDPTLAWKSDEFTTTGTLYIVPVPEVTSLRAIVSAAAMAVAAHRRRPRGMLDRSG